MLTGINPFKSGDDKSLVDKMNDILNKEIPIPRRLSVEARDLLKQILAKDPANRIGCREKGGVEELKQHAWFRGLDWDMLYNKEIPPPFVPQTQRASDVSNVDPEFLREVPEETPVQDSYLVAMAKEDGDFDNFTYVNENHMSALEQASTNQNRLQTEMVIAK